MIFLKKRKVSDAFHVISCCNLYGVCRISCMLRVEMKRRETKMKI